MSAPLRPSVTAADPAGGGAAPPVGYIARLGEILLGLQAFAKAFVLTFVLSEEQFKKYIGRWGSHIPALALALADVFDFEPKAFAALGLTPQRMRDRTEEVRVLTNLKTITDDLGGKLAAHLVQAKASLAQETLDAVDEINAFMGSKLSNVDVVARLLPVVLPMNQIIAEYNAKILTTRDNNQQLKDQGTEQVSSVEEALRRKELELSVRDGHEIPAGSLSGEATAGSKAKAAAPAKAKGRGQKTPPAGPKPTAKARRAAKR